MPSKKAAALAAVQRGSSGPLLPRVPQHDTLHTLNHVMLSAGYTAIQTLVQGTTSAHVRQRCRSLQSLARKATVRMDLSIKRSVCRRCGMALVPGVTASIRTRPSPSAHMVLVTRCRLCTWQRSMPCPPLVQTRLSDKVGSRRRRKHFEAKAAETAKKKIARASQSMPNRVGGLVAHAPTADHGISSDTSRSGQRARRRRARALMVARKAAQGEKTTQPVKRQIKQKKRSRRRSLPLGTKLLTMVPQKDASSRSVFLSAGKEEHLWKGRGVAPGRDTRKGRQKQARTAALALSMPRFSERVQSKLDQETDWTQAQFGLAHPHSSAQAHLSQRQRNAINQLRGNHIVTKGLGKGGAALAVESESST